MSIISFLKQFSSSVTNWATVTYWAESRTYAAVWCPPTWCLWTPGVPLWGWIAQQLWGCWWRSRIAGQLLEGRACWRGLAPRGRGQPEKERGKSCDHLMLNKRTRNNGWIEEETWFSVRPVLGPKWMTHAIATVTIFTADLSSVWK